MVQSFVSARTYFKLPLFNGKFPLRPLMSKQKKSSLPEARLSQVFKSTRSSTVKRANELSRALNSPASYTFVVAHVDDGELVFDNFKSEEVFGNISPSPYHHHALQCFCCSICPKLWPCFEVFSQEEADQEHNTQWEYHQECFARGHVISSISRQLCMGSNTQSRRTYFFTQCKQRKESL